MDSKEVGDLFRTEELLQFDQTKDEDMTEIEKMHVKSKYI